MAWWVYKCNSRNNSYQGAYGDWEEYFDKDGREQWGSTDWVPALANLKKGDMVIAYQTDRNQLVGLAKVRQSCEKDTYVYLTPVDRISPVKVRLLKKSDSKIAAIPAFLPGPVQTLYSISKPDAQRLLKAAGFNFKFR